MNQQRKAPFARMAMIVVLIAVLAVAAFPQLRQVIKAVGATLAVRQFSGDLNRGMNRITGWKDTNAVKTKVVPILSVGINARNAIGAAQVIGPAGRRRKGSSGSPDRGRSIRTRGPSPRTHPDRQRKGSLESEAG
jgi:hypothetical protein